MEPVKFMRWEISCDPDETRRAYERFRAGGADECACEDCRNFAVQRDSVYPPQVLELLKNLGIDYRKETEVYQFRLQPGSHEYHGWFHFIGELLSGQDAHQKVAKSSTPLTYRRDHERVVEDFAIGITAHVSLMLHEQEVFKEMPVLCLEFSVNLPWVLDSPESE